MNQLLKYTLLLFLVAFAACSSEDDAASTVPNGQPQPGDALELTVSAADFVTDGAPDTRATDNGKETTFEDGDRVGIIILDENSRPIYDNIPYKYDSSNNTWIFDNRDGKGGCYYDTNAATYIVYYPYSRAADGVTSVNDLKTKFAPRLNQSDIEDYRSSDLMVWNRTGHLASSETTLNAVLEHAFASVYLTLKVGNYVLEDNTSYDGSRTPDISDVSLTIDNAVYVPYQEASGRLRCIVPADITPGDIRCFYTIGSKTYGNTISISNAVEANTRYACEPPIGDVTYSLGNARVGDYYCKNNDKGYLVPGDATLTDAQKSTCLGIVMKVGKDDNGNWKDDCQYKLKDNSTSMDIIHGYVLALYDANADNTCQWGSYGEEVNTNKEMTTGFYGYNNTQTIIDYDNQNGLNLQSNFPATYYATEDYENKHSAPNNSSGWFLPSAGQCWYWLLNKDTISTSMTNAGGDRWSNYYWSSSECDARNAWFVDINSGQLGGNYKYGNGGSVRSCLAF